MKTESHKIQLTLVIDLRGWIDIHDEDEWNWLVDEVLKADVCALISNEPGDEVGIITEIKNIKKL